MEYQPITEGEQKQAFIDWLENVVKDLNGMRENKSERNIFPNSETGDVGTVKDIVGGFLSTLTGKPVTIN